MISPSFVIISFGILVSMYVTWMLFRIEEFSEEQIIDLIIITIVSALLGGRVVWLWEHWGEIDHSIASFLHISLDGFSLIGLVVVPLVTVSLFLRKIDWPYWVSLDRLSVGALFTSLFVSLGLGYENKLSDVYPVLLGSNELTISAWWLFLLFASFIAIWFFLIRRVNHPGYVMGLFLIGTLRVSLLLTGLVAWLIIRYSYLWQKKIKKNN
ncbi:prolipoprotein diacylglyceryl transferase [candidate division WWE3 bacterium]|uniref:Prolipoprotein diacylglyceryl transferase n=1 Tax=candidate division WWE3 bacterium TaxID=2053526 RepID=A0A955LW62_UNCKA|nr:prolipoprotein diacylglyceryl transferase [candidate division WWE3 bacterium]